MNSKNQLTETLSALRESYGDNTPLCDMKDAEFKEGGCVELAISLAGFVDGSRSVIGSYGWWNLTAKEFSEEILAHVETPVQD